MEICRNVENARMQNKTRAVYEGIWKITGKHAPQIRTFKDQKGKILSEPKEVKARWKEYNDMNPVDEDYLDNFSEA